MPVRLIRRDMPMLSSVTVPVPRTRRLSTTLSSDRERVLETPLDKTLLLSVTAPVKAMRQPTETHTSEVSPGFQTPPVFRMLFLELLPARTTPAMLILRLEVSTLSLGYTLEMKTRRALPTHSLEARLVPRIRPEVSTHFSG